MRILFIIIVVGALGYLGWVFREELTGKIEQVTGSKPTATATAGGSDQSPPPTTSEPGATEATPMPKLMAPAGSLYVRERVSIETPTGVKALNAGELVKIMYRNKDGTARVTTEKADLVIKESLLTPDPSEIKR